MGETRSRSSKRTLREITAGYDRLARFYRLLEPLYLIFAPARRKAVDALRLSPGDVVLEIGSGTGRNLQYLAREVGSGGTIIGVDASPGMLAQAKLLVDARAWDNVELIEQDAEQLTIDRDLDGVLFSLSYSVIPNPVRGRGVRRVGSVSCDGAGGPADHDLGHYVNGHGILQLLRCASYRPAGTGQ